MATSTAGTKTVHIQLTQEALERLYSTTIRLCFAKAVDSSGFDSGYNVVWQSYNVALLNNTFSWKPQYQLFGANNFSNHGKVIASTNQVNIGLGETSTLSSAGVLGAASTGGPDTACTMNNEYGTIHPGLNQLSTGINGEEISTPIYVSTNPLPLEAIIRLTPLDMILVWFEENIETSTMFSGFRRGAIKIDLTTVNEATRLYDGNSWSTPS